MSQPNRTTFPNGLTVISRPRPGSHSAAVGLWLLNGSRHEQPAEHGYAHLLEHLFFKGCGDWDAMAIARMTDRWGGQVNAFTGREMTALHGLVPANRLTDLAQLLVAMVLEPRFSASDLAAEQGVILQEMAAQADAPDEAVETRAVELACGGHPFGRDILGTAASVEAGTVQALQAYRRGLLQGKRLAVVAVGAVDHQALCEAVRPLTEIPAGERAAIDAPRLLSGDHRERHATEQAHLLWVLPAPAAAQNAHAIAALGNHLLGDGVSSRLFQEIRERQGLVYDIHSRLETYADCGLWFIQTACRPREAARCRAAVENVLAELTRRGPSADELADARDHVAAALQLEQDALEAHMEILAREHFYLGRHPSLEERLAQVQGVTAEAVRTLLEHAWQARLHLTWQP